MNALKKNWRRIVTGLPLLSIVLASFFPLQQRVQQALILFALLWFNVFIVFEVLGSR